MPGRRAAARTPVITVTLETLLRQRIQDRGPLTVAAFMDLALYHPVLGYYARAAQRSGVGGDFYTSVDAGPLFGELLARLVVRMVEALGPAARVPERFDLVEAGAGNGRLARDVLDALAVEAPASYAALRLALVERSAAARAAQAGVLGVHAAKVAWSAEAIQAPVQGLVYANELLDALPCHRVRQGPEGLEELYVALDGDRLALRPGPPSSDAVAGYFERTGVSLPAGCVADVSPAALEWVSAAARALERGWLLIIDYGREAEELFGPSHPDGTLRGYWRHLVDAPLDRRHAGGAARPAWLARPGEQDLTYHVDLAAVRRAAVGAGLVAAGDLDQGRFLLDLGLADILAAASGRGLADVRRRLAARALALPGGLGSTHRALLFAKGVPPSAVRLSRP